MITRRKLPQIWNTGLKRNFSSVFPAHGGTLQNLMVSGSEEAELLRSSTNFTFELNDRQACDVELLINGGFSPLTGPMNKTFYEHTVENMRLPAKTGEEQGVLFGLPVVLDTNCTECGAGDRALLRYQGQDIAVLDIEDKYKPNKPKEVKQCYGTSELEHPGVQMVAMERGKFYLGGVLTGLALPQRVFPCKTPSQLRNELPSMHGKDVVAFQCRNPVHRAHYELFMRALDADNVDKENGALVLVHPTVGPTQSDDIDGTLRYKTYEVLKAEIDDPRASHAGMNRVEWAYLPYSMHMAGPREAIQHMIIRKNYGCTHFIIGRDMAGSKSSLTGEDYYGAYDAQELAKLHSDELLVKVVPSLNLSCVEFDDGTFEYMTSEEAEAVGGKSLKLSGTEFRRRLRAGEEIPEWFAFKSVVKVLMEESEEKKYPNSSSA